MDMPMELPEVTEAQMANVHVVFYEDMDEEARERFDEAMREQYYWWDSIPTPDPNAPGM